MVFKKIHSMDPFHVYWTVYDHFVVGHWIITYNLEDGDFGTFVRMQKPYLPVSNGTFFTRTEDKDIGGKIEIVECPVTKGFILFLRILVECHLIS